MTTSKICDRHLTLRNCHVRGETLHILNLSPPPRLVCWLTKENYLKPLEDVSQVFSSVVMLFVLGIKISHGYRHADSLPGKPSQVHGPGDLGSPAAPTVQVCCFLSSKVQICRDPYLQCKRPGLIPGSGRFPWIGEWHPTPVFWPGKFYRQRSLAGYSPWHLKESDTTEEINTFSPTMGSKDFIALLSSCTEPPYPLRRCPPLFLSVCGNLCLQESCQAWLGKGH